MSIVMHRALRHIAASTKPKIIYGTGDGADKLLAVFSSSGITADGFFASGGFVRDRLFHGKHVMSFEEAEKEYGDFLCILGFGSSLPDVIANIKKVSASHEFFAPDLSVAGELLFDESFCSLNAALIDKATGLLSDRRSAEVFESIISYRLSWDISALAGSFDTDESVFSSLLRFQSYNAVVDAGAYTGDTAKTMLCLSQGSIKKLIAIEPDPRSFRKLLLFAEEHKEVVPVFGAAGESCGTAFVSASGNRGNSRNGKTDSLQVPSFTVDSLTGCEKTDFIKYDVEGAEADAIRGSTDTIKEWLPDLCVSLYHRREDIFALPLLIDSIAPGKYDYYIRRPEYIPPWDLRLYCIRK